MNQLFQQLNHQPLDASTHQPPQNNKLNQIKQTFQRVKMMSDPIGYIKSSPEMQSVIELINQNGGNAQQVFYKLAEQKGVNPNQILDIFK